MGGAEEGVGAWGEVGEAEGLQGTLGEVHGVAVDGMT